MSSDSLNAESRIWKYNKNLATASVARFLFIINQKKIIFKSMVSRIVNPIANSPQHFCLRAAIEYPINTIKTEQSRLAPCQDVNI